MNGHTSTDRAACQQPGRTLDRRGGTGVVLLILLVGVAIVFVVMFMPGGSAETAVEAREFAETSVAGFDMTRVSRDVSIYQLANNRVPADIHELYDGNPRAKADQWGGEMSIELILNARGDRATEVVVRSAGPDGEWGTEDDLEGRYGVQ